MHIIPAPSPRDLLPPLLACLPTAFLSPRPPPALLPLLSPILRQRVNLLSGSTSTRGNDGWLPLLSWDSGRASKLASKIEGLQLEPHPVSGELELQDIEKIQYRRLDPETLQTRLEVEEFELLPVYLWVENDEGGAGWRLAELRALEDSEDGTEWYGSAAEATEASQQHAQRSALPQTSTSNQQTAVSAPQNDDDDDYWASYDQTPGRTPARRSPAPNKPATTSQPTDAESESDYYARYGTEVQPALDSHDPDEETPDTGTSTLNGTTLENPRSHPTEPLESSNIGQNGYDSSLPPPYTAKSLYPADSPMASSSALDASIHSELTAPRPTSPSSQGSVDRLERGAADMTRAEVGVKQFVSTEVKSLFRLARSVGIDRAEFERIVKVELDVLGMMEADD